MKVGLIVRCDDRGLGNQTWEVYRHLPHEKVLVVRDPGSEKQGFPPRMDRYPDGTVVWFGRDAEGLPEKVCRDWLEGLEVVYSAETFYDWNFVTWAREAGVATVLHVNPEFYFHWRGDGTPMPSTLWSPTPWRSEHLPDTTRVVPVPVPIDRWGTPDFNDNPNKVLHVGGLEAIRDRNGTKIARDVDRILGSHSVHIPRQGHSGGRNRRAADVSGVRNYWELYDGFPVILMPRRYGGLCLPAIEALGAGLLPFMTDTSPNDLWPHVSLPCERDLPDFHTQGGDIQLYKCDPKQVADIIRGVYDSGDLPEMRREAYQWAQDNSWDELVGLWMAELVRAIREL